MKKYWFWIRLQLGLAPKHVGEQTWRMRRIEVPEGGFPQPKAPAEPAPIIDFDGQRPLFIARCKSLAAYNTARERLRSTKSNFTYVSSG